MENLQRYLINRGGFTPLEADQVVASFTTKVLRKHQSLLQQGDVWRYHAFVSKGCLRTYTVDEKGLEHVISFSTENWWPGDCESLISGAPSNYNIEALEDCKILLIHNEQFIDICRQVPGMNNMVNAMYQRSFAAAQERINAFLQYTAEEKYRYFIKKYPAIPNRVPLHMIASYLGITKETLSRIRNTLRKEMAAGV